MAAPWERATVNVDEALVAAVLAEQLPALAVTALRYLHQGWDSRAFVATIDGAPWVLRFPNREEVARRVELEIALLPHLGPRLPAAIPRFEIVGAPSPRYPFRFVGYRMIPGAIAMGADPAALDVPALATALGRFLAALHVFPIEEAARLGVDEAVWHRDLGMRAGEALDRLQEIADQVPPDDAAACRALMEHLPPAPQNQRLVHNDLSSEHMLIAPPSTLSGVIDWSDIQIGDGAADFSGAFYLLGEPGLAGALAAYPLPLDDGFAARARFHAACRAVEDIVYGTATGQPLYVAAGRRVLAWRGEAAR